MTKVPTKGPQGKVSSTILRVVDNNRTNTKSTNKNNIINGTANQLHYPTNLTTQHQLANSLQELNNNNNNNINNKNSGILKEVSSKQLSKKQQLKQQLSLTDLFDQFTEVITLDDLEDQNENLTQSPSKNTAFLLNLACDFTSKDQKSKWEAILFNNNLYLQIPAGVLFETSKEAFVNLLELAEEELKCQSVIICLDKNCVEKCKCLSLNCIFKLVNQSIIN